MVLDWNSFTPYAALIGGALIGLASVALVLAIGRIAGISSSGCTSGHGVCGLSRASPRSLAATLAFMGAGFATVFLVRHVLA
jgi:hypothetical protein